MNRRTLPITLLLLVVALLAAGLQRLFELRFAAGDIFPPASSRRADPLGSRALHDALSRQPGIGVSRNLLPLDRTRARPGLAILVLGVAPENIDTPGIPDSFNRHLLRLAGAGARVVLAVQHESSELATNVIRQGVRTLARAMQTNATTPLRASLGFSLDQHRGTEAAAQPGANIALATSAVPGLPPRLPWPSPWRLAALSNAWTTLYQSGDQPVVAERAWGQGSVVLLASDYLLSNEALRRSPQPAFIAGLLGGATEILFDETHLGLTFEPGMAGLIRRYQLGGAALGLALLVLLYLWRSYVPFHPPNTRPASQESVPGRGSAEAFLALLRRALGPESIVEVCLHHWRASQGRHPGVAARRIADAQDLLDIEMERPPSERDPVATYRRIAGILNPRRPAPSSPHDLPNRVPPSPR